MRLYSKTIFKKHKKTRYLSQQKFSFQCTGERHMAFTRIFYLTTVRAVGTARSASCQHTRLRTWCNGWHNDPEIKILNTIIMGNNINYTHLYKNSSWWQINSSSRSLSTVKTYKRIETLTQCTYICVYKSIDTQLYVP